MKEKVRTNLKDYKQTYDELQNKDDEDITLQGMLDYSKIFSIMERNRRLLWTIISSIAVIMFIRMAKKRLSKS